MGFICDTLPFTHSRFSGAELSCEFMAHHYQGLGNEIFFITSRIDFNKSNHRVYSLFRGLGKEFPFSFHVIFQMLMILLREKPDTLYFVTKKYFYAALFACIITKTKVVYSVVDYHILCSHNTLLRSDGSICTCRSDTCLLRHRFMSFWYKYVDVFLAFTDVSKMRLVEWGVPEDKIIVFYQFDIDPDSVSSYPCFFEGVMNVLFVGSVLPHKGVDVVVRAFESVVEFYPDACLHVVGSLADKVFVDRVKELAAGLDVFKNIVFHGHKSHSEVLSMIKSADCVVVCEQWYSDFGNLVLFEAKRLGVPSVSGDLGSAEEFASFVVPYDKPVVFGDMIVTVLKGKEYCLEDCRWV